MLTSCLTVLILLFLNLAQPGTTAVLTNRWEDLSVKHSWAEIPLGWELAGPAPANHTLDLHITLKPANPSALRSELLQVSDPTHERYGLHLSKEEVEALVAPHSDSISLVDSWLRHHQIDPSTARYRSGGGKWISIQVTVIAAERLLGTSYNLYRQADSGSLIVRTMSYSIPRILHDHINLVTPTTYFGNLMPMRATHFLEHDSPVIAAANLAQCDRAVTPRCLMELYKIKGYTPSRRSTLGVAGYLNEFANHSDLKKFLTRYRPEARGASFVTISIHGGLNNQTQPGEEANLDIQYTEALSYPIKNVYYSTGGSPPFNPDSVTQTNTNEPYLGMSALSKSVTDVTSIPLLDWLHAVLANATIPQTISTSYGDDEQTVPYDYASEVCDLFATLGARGASVLFPSGDSGVGGDDCEKNDGTNTVVFQPTFPASCPYVTVVGGTTGISPEKAVSFSGGGFSNYFKLPTYQESAVAGYRSFLGTTYDGFFNKSGRGYPDVAAQAKNFAVIVGNERKFISGTSASTPVFAAVVSLLNDIRLQQRRPPLGFLNPLLYSKGIAGLVDITKGSNPGCNTSGFPATVGWDAVTGLGTPDFKKLREIITRL